MRSGFSFLVLVGTIMLSCGDHLDIRSPEFESKVVIDGSIENGKFPVVYLTLSSGYYDPVDSIELLRLVLTTAKVTVSDGENSEVLTLFRNTDVFPPFYYGGTDLRGEVGKTYTIEVVSKGEVYTASTEILPPISVDSLWVIGVEDEDSLVNLRLRLTDSPGNTDYFRVFTRVVNKDENFIPTYQSVFSDRLFNGEVFDLTILKGSESFTDVENDFYFTRGDTVSVKLCLIDQGHFEFWRSLERELYLTGNPFGSSGNQIETNISGTKPALGVWGGYGVSIKTIIIK